MLFSGSFTVTARNVTVSRSAGPGSREEGPK